MLPNVYFMASLQEKVVFGMLILGAALSLSFSCYSILPAVTWRRFWGHFQFWII